MTESYMTLPKTATTKKWIQITSESGEQTNNVTEELLPSSLGSVPYFTRSLCSSQNSIST
jgi:hypothetical protein